MSENSKKDIIAFVSEFCERKTSYDALIEKNMHSAADAIVDELRDMPASVRIRSGWENYASKFRPDQFWLELSGGGPATRIIGELDNHAEVYSVQAQHQDWFEPWTDLVLDEQEEKAVKWFASLFYYGG